MRNTVCTHITILLLLLTAHYAEAQQAYVSLQNGDLVEIDVEQCTSRRIGRTSVPMYDIAIGPGGVMYGIGQDNRLYKIDLKDATTTLIGPLKPKQGDDFNSLVFSDSGIMYAATNQSTFLYKIDTTNANQTELGNIGYQAAGDLTFFDGVLYMAARNNFLIRVNIANPEKSAPVGKMNAAGAIFGVVTVGSIDCKGGRPKMYALGGNLLYEVSLADASTKRVCPNLRLNSTIYGAASAVEATPQLRANAGRDTLLNLCENTNQIRLAPLVGLKDSAGTWYGPEQLALTSDPIVDISGLSPGTYRYFYTVGEGNCADTATVSLTLDRLEPDFPKDTTLCQGQMLLINLEDSAAKYLWQDGATTATYSISKPGTFSVEVTKSCGQTEATVEVNYETCDGCNVFFPDAFSPNGDGQNDLFGPISDCQFSTFSLRVYNRWGEVVFQSNDPKQLWDGRFRSQYVSSGTYVYRLNYQFLTDPALPGDRMGKVVVIR
ncbi:gliding motility-associated C-terminal domain-containing protein [Persicitalea sp.]|uniref:T9SS type B sorting domain-containing protein n=1 Tax=Persicitalea sp. TaxID=3100273 RepID=UPI00359432C6